MGENSEGQRVIIKMAVFNFFLFADLRRSRLQLIDIHGAQAAGEEQLLGIKQLIQLFAGLLPGDHAGNPPGGAGEQDKQQRQAQAQAQTIVDNAVADANSVRQGSIQYTDDMLKSLQTIMNHTMEGAQGRFDAFMNSMKSSYDIVSSNRKELSSGIITEKEESAEPEKQDSTEA